MKFSEVLLGALALFAILSFLDGAPIAAGCFIAAALVVAIISARG